MMDLADYTIIYKDQNKQILVNKTEYNYSVILKEGDALTEVIVSAEQVDNSMTFPEADKLPWKKQFELLFGNAKGFDLFIKYCEEKDIDTQTLIWD